VVTAGNAQLRNIHAVVCVNVHEERTVVSVLEGVAEFSELGARGARREFGGIVLRAGDRV
jgi:ferric-dicitrate binding protein FerR (iron transport regulator)